MVIIIAVAVIFGVYEVGNSVSFRNSIEVLTKEHNKTIERIKNIGDKDKKEITVNGYIKLNRITQDEVNELY